MYECAYKYANVGVNDRRAYGHAYGYVYGYAGSGVNTICLYGHTTTFKLSSASVNN